jgi:hypothetical protein
VLRQKGDVGQYVGQVYNYYFCNLFSFLCTVYEMMLKNLVETKGPQMMSQYGAYALHAG